MSISSKYLDLLKVCLTRTMDLKGSELERRIEGLDWPLTAETMVSYKRLDNLRELIQQVINERIKGDLIETGVWRGGASIFMKAILATAESNKKIYVCDSFQGFPKSTNVLDDEFDFLEDQRFAISVDEVRRNFEKYSLLDDNVIFVKGWFEETLPTLQGPFSLLRLDGDLFSSTNDALRALYPKLVDGGFCIIDDYSLSPCKAAVDSYRALNGIREPMMTIDHSAAYWRKDGCNSRNVKDSLGISSSAKS